MLKTLSGRRASQDEDELNGFIALLKSERVESYLEIGSREGDTFYDVVRTLPVGSHAVAVDLPGALWGKRTTGKQLYKAADALRLKGYVVTVILGNSTNEKVVEAIRSHGPFDAALIDGDHRYEGAQADWLHFGSMARLVAFHDIVGHGQAERVHGNKVEVPRLWSEIKAEHRCAEFITQGSSMGIGCVLR